MDFVASEITIKNHFHILHFRNTYLLLHTVHKNKYIVRDVYTKCANNKKLLNNNLHFQIIHV